MPRLTENGEFVIPLYHGTSSLFSESILKLGLGSVDPIKQFSVLPFMRHLYELTEPIRSNDSEWLAARDALKWILDQSVLEGGANFQHGQSYLTPSRSSAVGYALTNRFGSELLSQTHRLFCWLKENRPSEIDEMRLDHHPVSKLFGSSYDPVLITAHRVSLSQLVAENGGPIEPVIEMLTQFLSIFKEPAREALMRPDVVCNFNFRLRAGLIPGAVELEYLDSRREINPYTF